MGTKNNPGKFDCYDKIGDDEPFFVLRAKDPSAARLVRQWAADYHNGDYREHEPIDWDKYCEAEKCADAMDSWQQPQEDSDHE